MWTKTLSSSPIQSGINAFDQPNVQEGKDNTNHLLAEVQEKGRLPEQKPALAAESLRLYGRVAGTTIEEAMNNFQKPAGHTNGTIFAEKRCYRFTGNLYID